MSTAAEPATSKARSPEEHKQLVDVFFKLVKQIQRDGGDVVWNRLKKRCARGKKEEMKDYQGFMDLVAKHFNFPRVKLELVPRACGHLGIVVRDVVPTDEEKLAVGVEQMKL